MEVLINLYGETVIVTENENGTATATMDNGETKTFSSYEKAIFVLYKMGYRF